MRTLEHRAKQQTHSEDYAAILRVRHVMVPSVALIHALRLECVLVASCWPFGGQFTNVSPQECEW